MKVRPYRPGDFEHIRHRPQDNFGSAGRSGTRLMCEMGNTFVAEHDGIPIAIWGAVMLWDGVAYMWSIVGEDARGHGIELTNIVKKMVNTYCDLHKIVRCETYVNDGVYENERWVKLLGFEYECTHKYGAPSGNDLHIYTRIHHE